MEKEADPSNNGRDAGAGDDQRREKTATGIKIKPRKRSAVMKDFEKIVGPLSGRNGAKRD
ncbi:MAG TPA: hypothetical protein VFR04_02815 [Solirubrobacterales bacterium]|nr:hypothetical protein [Solirubrobacterales bacterium]